MIKNILWDLDGTIFDTYPAITYAISRSLNEMGFSLALNVIDGLARQSMDHCLETLSQRFQLDVNVLRERFNDIYRDVSPARQVPFAGVRDVCEWIHAHGGMNIIVTHRRMQSTQALLDFHDLNSSFDDILCVEQGFPRKPDPALVVAALEKHALVPAETLMIGDRELDMQAGAAAGTQTCLFGNNPVTSPADIRVDSFEQLLRDHLER